MKVLFSLLPRFRYRAHDHRGDVVQKVVLIAGFTMIAVILVTWLSSASANKAADSSKCIEKARALTYEGGDWSGSDSIADQEKSPIIYCGGGGSYNNWSHSTVYFTSSDDQTVEFHKGDSFQRNSAFVSRYPGQGNPWNTYNP